VSAGWTLSLHADSHPTDDQTAPLFSRKPCDGGYLLTEDVPMQTLSSPTLAVLIKIAVERTNPVIVTSLLAANLDRFDKGGSPKESKEKLVQRTLINARKAAEGGDKDAHRGLLKFAKEMTTSFPHPDKEPPEGYFFQLRDALLADGYDLQWENPTVHIRPTEAPGAEMSREITALQAQLDAAGHDVALNHYSQAIDNLNHHNYEASNSALRTMFEDLLLRVANNFGYTGSQKGGAAVNWMVNEKKVVPDNWGDLLKGAWKISHTEGSHPGRSNADEARFRMVILTSVARRLLQHVEARS
jgi:hypothetical protein